MAKNIFTYCRAKKKDFYADVEEAHTRLPDGASHRNTWKELGVDDRGRLQYCCRCYEYEIRVVSYFEV